MKEKFSPLKSFKWDRAELYFHVDKFCTCVLIGQSNRLSLEACLQCLYERRYLFVIAALNVDNATYFTKLLNKLSKVKIPNYVVTLF